MVRYLRPLVAARVSVCVVLLVAVPVTAQISSEEPATTLPAQTFVAAHSRLPLSFEDNHGQTDPSVRFLARGAGYRMFLTSDSAVIALDAHTSSPGSEKLSEAMRSVALLMRFVGADASLAISGEEPLARRSHYFVGNDPARYVTDVAHFARVRYANVYPGIDVVYYGNERELEYDVVVAPKADPAQVEIAFDGIDQMSLSNGGDLVLRTALGDLAFRQPAAYQQIDGAKRLVDVRYRLTGNDRIGFQLGTYDADHPLVVDPILTLATNLWGNASGVATDASNNIYIVGYTATADLPVAGGYQTQLAGNQDAYVAKLNPSGTGVLYTTYLGARRATTSGLAIAVDSVGNAYVTGTTTSSSFPVTPGAYQTSGSTFVTKFNAAGNVLAYSTYVTASVASIAVDSTGSVFMTGTAGSLSTTAGVFQPTKLGTSSPYVAKLNSTGSAIVYATYLGGSANDEGKGIAIDAAGNAYVVGVARSTNFPTQNALRASLSGTTDAFVAKLNPAGTALVYSTYLGGSANERGFGIAVNAAGEAFVTGWTNSTNFPVTAGAFQRTIGYPDPAVSNAFISKLNNAGNALIYSSYLGGKWCLTATVFSCFGFFSSDEGIDVGTSVAVDAAGYAYIGGYVTSAEFPQADAIQSVGDGGDISHVPFAAKVMPNGDKLVYAAVLGARTQSATVSQIAVDRTGAAIAVGNTPGVLFPLTAGALQGSSTAVLFKLSPGIYPTTVLSSSNPSAPAQPITLTANVLNPAPGGVVTFKEGATTLGTANVTNGAATISVTLPAGVHRISASSSTDGKVSPEYFQLVRGQ